MTGRPAALSALAFASTASVADSAMAAIRAEILVGASAMAPMIPSSRRVRVSTRLGLTGRFDGSPAATYTSGSGGVHQWRAHARASRHRAVAQLARVPVSKTGGWGFESLLPCEYGPCTHGHLAAPADS